MEGRREEEDTASASQQIPGASLSLCGRKSQRKHYRLGLESVLGVLGYIAHSIRLLLIDGAKLLMSDLTSHPDGAAL